MDTYQFKVPIFRLILCVDLQMMRFESCSESQQTEELSDHIVDIAAHHSKSLASLRSAENHSFENRKYYYQNNLS